MIFMFGARSAPFRKISRIIKGPRCKEKGTFGKNTFRCPVVPDLRGGGGYATGTNDYVLSTDPPCVTYRVTCLGKIQSYRLHRLFIAPALPTQRRWEDFEARRGRRKLTLRWSHLDLEVLLRLEWRCVRGAQVANEREASPTTNAQQHQNSGFVAHITS